jgi:thymidine kinase
MAKLYFYYSAMNAGKTTTLLQSEYNYRERGMNTLLLTPAFDNRYGQGKITSRIGLQSDAILFYPESNLFEIAKSQHCEKPLHCILVDEAQFLTKQQVFELTEIVDVLKIPTLSYGLRSDFRAEPFEGSKYLMTWADALHEIKTVCHCGKKASHVLRLDEEGRVLTEGNTILIGGNDRYVSVCRKHYKLQKPHHS